MKLSDAQKHGAWAIQTTNIPSIDIPTTAYSLFMCKISSFRKHRLVAVNQGT